MKPESVNLSTKSGQAQNQRLLSSCALVVSTESGLESYDPVMMREAFVGFDSAWAGKTPGGIAWATFTEGRLTTVAEPNLGGFDEAAQVIQALQSEHDYVLVAVDQPTVVPNETGSRPVDGIAASLISRLGGGVQPANRGKAAMFGANAPIWRFLERLGASQNPPAARTMTHGLHLLEVFPALALPALEPEIMKRKRAVSYNPANKRTFSCDDWRLVAGAVRRRADELGIERLSRWAGQAVARANPAKSDQDCLDAAICLIVALEWRRARRDRVMVIGNGRTGYMVTPVSPETRAIFERAATAKHVPFDAPWPDAERSPNTTTARTDATHDGRGADSTGSGTTRRRSGRRHRIVFDETLLKRCLVKAARAGRMLTYGEVARRFNIPWSQGASTALAGTLKRIGEENRRRGEPQLMALVVSKENRMPGPGFFKAIGNGSSIESEQRARHEQHLQQVWNFDWPD